MDLLVFLISVNAQVEELPTDEHAGNTRFTDTPFEDQTPEIGKMITRC